MQKLSFALTALGLVLASTFAQAWTPDSSDKMELSVAQAILTAKVKDPSPETWFDTAYGYAVFTIAEGGLMYEATVGGQTFKYKAKN